MKNKEPENNSNSRTRSLSRGGTLLLISGITLILCSAVYNEFLVGLFVRDLPLIFRAIPKIRNSEIDFLLWGSGLVCLSFLTSRIRWLSVFMQKRFLENMILSLVTVLLPITILELTLRPFASLPGRATKIFVNDDELGWKLKPLARGKVSNVNVSVNSKGLRDREIPYTRTRNQKRILFIGDSVTFGFGLESDQTFPYLVQKILNETSNDSVETINAGVTGYSLWQEYTWLSREGMRYKPDLIVLSFVLNDVTDWLSLRKFGGWDEATQFVNTSLLDELATTSNIVYFIRMIGAKIRFGNQIQLGAHHLEQLYVGHLAYSPDRPDVQEAWKITLQDMNKIVETCRDKGIPLVLLIFPYRFQFDDPQKLSAPQQIVRRFARERDVVPIDLLPVLNHSMIESGKKPSDYFLDDLHPSGRGNLVVADTLARFISARQLLGPR